MLVPLVRVFGKSPRRNFLSEHGLLRSVLGDIRGVYQCAEWQSVKSEFDDLFETTSLRGNIEVDPSSDGRGVQQGNSMCKTYHSETDYAFIYPWVGISYLNPIYTIDFISKILKKAISDFNKELVNTSFMFVMLDWNSAPWYPLLDQFEILI